MRREILVSLGQGELPPMDLPTVVGAALGLAAGKAVKAGREFMKRLGLGFSGDDSESVTRRPPPTLLAGD
jgi:hypothetical protein